MLCRQIRTRDGFRSGPNAAEANTTFLQTSDAHMQGGVLGEDSFVTGRIEVYTGRGPDLDENGEPMTRYAVVRSPHTDKSTGEPIVTFIPMESVTSWQPMAAAERTRLYPERKPSTDVPKSEDKAPAPETPQVKGAAPIPPRVQQQLDQARQQQMQEASQRGRPAA